MSELLLFAGYNLHSYIAEPWSLLAELQNSEF